MADKSLLMDADEISSEIFNGRITTRVISEKYAKDPRFPKVVQRGTRGKKFWRRSDIYKHYGLDQVAA